MMRPDAEAVGLICILAHDYSIVNIKMLIRYYVTVVYNQLSIDWGESKIVSSFIHKISLSPTLLRLILLHHTPLLLSLMISHSLQDLLFVA